MSAITTCLRQSIPGYGLKGNNPRTVRMCNDVAGHAKGGPLNSTYLEVGIGLAVVFFVVATLADGLNEILSRLLNTRAKALWGGLTGLLSDQSEQKPDLGIGFIVKSIPPSWLGGLDFRPRIAGDAIGAVDRMKLIEWIVTGKDRVPEERRATARRAFDRVYDRAVLPAKVQLRSKDAKLRWWLEKVDDEKLLALARDLHMEYGDVEILYPPLQEPEVRRRLLPHHLAGNDDGRMKVAEWLVKLPLDTKADLLARHLPITATIMAVLTGDNRDEARRLGQMTNDQQRYLDQDPGLGKTLNLMRSVDGHRLVSAYLLVHHTEVPTTAELSRWLFGLPIADQLGLMQQSTMTGRYLTSAARAAALLGSASVSGLDYVRNQGRRTKVWWMDGRTFGSALWELAKDRLPETGPQDRPGERLETDATEGVRVLAEEWRGTPLGDYLASTALDRARSVDQFVANAGAWFDGQMDQLSLSYRRNVKYVLGAMGFAMALLFNLNALGLATALINDADARATLDAYSQSLLANGCGGGGGAGAGDDEAGSEEGGSVDLTACSEAAQKVDAQLDELRTLDDLGVPLLSTDWRAWRGTPGPSELLGMAVTAVAVSFGGVFWYDFLKFLTGVRRRV